MRQQQLLNWISLRHLLREKRTWLTLIGVALGISVFISIRIANKSVLHAYHQSVDAFVGETTIEVVGRSGRIDENILVDLRREPAISEISPIIQSVLPMESPATARGELLLLMGIDLLQESTFRNYEVEGEKDDIDITTAFEALLDPSAVIITEQFADRHHLEAGDSLSVRKGGDLLSFKVLGLLKGEGIARARDGNIGFIDIASAQWRLKKLGRLDRINLITDDSIPVDTILTRLEQRLGDTVLVRRPQQRNRQVEKMLGAFQMNLTALSTISLFVGLFLIYNTLLVSVVHRRNEIGMLRALGVDRVQIFRLFTIEGIAIGTTGGLIGVFMGALLARGVVQLLSQTVRALYVSIPPSPFSLPPALFIEGIGIGIIVSTCSAFYPAWQAARLKPREAMEGIYGPDVSGIEHRRLFLCGLGCSSVAYLLSQLPEHWGLSWNGYLAAALLLVAFSLIIPSVILLFSRGIRVFTAHSAPSWRLAQGHLEQAIRRNAPTISAFMAALAMMISVVIMIESFRKTVVLWIDQTIQADVIGFPASYMMSDSDESFPEDLLIQISQMAEIKAIDGYRSHRVLLRGETVELVGRDLDVHAKNSRYLFRRGRSEEVIQNAIDEKKILISEVLANRFQLQEEDLIEIPTPKGMIPFEIGGIFYDYGTDGGKLVFDRSHLKNNWNDFQIDVIAIYLMEPENAAKVRQKMLEQWGNQHGLAFTTNVKFKTEIMEIFDQTFLITYALEWIAIVVALLGIANTLFVSILERKREIGIVRSIGASQAQVIRIVLVEAFYMGIIGNIVALVCGFFLSLLLIFVINKASFGWTLQFHFPPIIILHSFLLAAGTALIAGYLPARKAAQLDLKEAIAYE